MIQWKNVNAIYQIYPRSFQDSNGDGVGDLSGITSRLGYLKGDRNSLGVDAIWISPFFVSPMVDFGYDVQDYKAVDPLFGSLDDFDELIAEANRRDILVMIDFVPNHTSDQHEWFQQALSSKDNPFRDYYHFRDPLPNGDPPNNWLSLFGGSSWEYDELSGQYYLHSFAKEQPDLNWANPNVRREMQDVLRFWLDRGVKGFRFDAIRWMSKDPEYRDEAPDPNYDPSGDPYHALVHKHSRYGAELDAYLKELTDVIDEYDNTIVIFEDYHDPTISAQEQIRRLYSINANTAYPMNLEPIHFTWRPREFASSIVRYQREKTSGSDMVMCVGNHDNSRIASRYGAERARLIALIQLTFPGLPIIYYGDELGMTDQPISPDLAQDPFGKTMPEKGFGRDPQRTPMQWDSSKNAGFSDAEKTWLPVAGNASDVNLEVQQNDEQSFFWLYKRLLALRRPHPVFRSGYYDPALVGEDVYYCNVAREGEVHGVVANFSDTSHGVLIDKPFEIMLSLQGTASVDNRRLVLEPLEGVIIRYI